MVPQLVDEWSNQSLDYWKAKLELMEEQKKHIRQWMAETTMKITQSIKKMKDVAEKLHEDLSRNVASISQCESTEALSTRTTGDVDDSSSYGDPTSLKTEAESPTINEPIEELPGENGDQSQTADSEDLSHRDDDPPQEDKLAGAHGYLDFKEFAMSPAVAEQSLVHTIKPQVLQAMELLIADDWEKVKKLYIVLKRVGRVDRLLVYELSNEVLKTGMVEEDKMEGFLSSIDLEPAEAIFQFGRALLILYHASLLLGGQESSVDNLDLDLFPELQKSRNNNQEVVGDTKKSNIYPRLCRQDLKKSMAERILKKQGEKLTEMFYANPVCKLSGSRSNPAYAHVKSRYMEGLKKVLDVPPSKRNKTNPMNVQSACSVAKKSSGYLRPKVKMLTGYEKSKIAITNPRNIIKEEWAEVDHNKNKLTITRAPAGIPALSTTPVGEGHTRKVSPTPQSSSSSSSASAKGDDSSTSTVVEKEVITTVQTSPSKTETLTKTIDKPSIIAPSNSMESMSVASASFGDQSTVAPGQQYITDFLAYDFRSTNFSSGDFYKPSFSLVEDAKELKRQASKTKLTMGVGSLNKPSWKLVNRCNSEPVNCRREVILDDKSELTPADVSSIQERTTQADTDAPERLSTNQRYVVFLKNKYVGVTVHPKSSQHRDSSPSRYYPAEELDNEGMIRTLYKNLPSLRPLIVDMLLTNIIVGYLLAITGDAFCDTGSSPKGFICTLSHALKDKLRSILIRDQGTGHTVLHYGDSLNGLSLDASS